jgi:hypothetical protein
VEIKVFCLSNFLIIACAQGFRFGKARNAVIIGFPASASPLKTELACAIPVSDRGVRRDSEFFDQVVRDGAVRDSEGS